MGPWGPAWRRGGVAGLVLGVGVSVWLRAGPADEKPAVSATYRFDSPHTEAHGDYTRLTVPGCGQLHRRGEPAMPFRTARLLLPPGLTVEDVELEPAAAPTPIEGNWLIEYSGQPHAHPSVVRPSVGGGNNRRIYGSNAFYPAAPAELLSIQRMAGYDIALVQVFPVRYRPASGQLWFTPEVTLRLTLAPTPPGAAPGVHPPTAKQAAERVAGFVDNPASIPVTTAWPDQTATPGPACDYLLITSSALASAFQPLVARKTQDGLAVKVVTIETITGTVAGQDVPEKVRNCIRQAYTEAGIRYVLLGGGTTIIPCRTAYVRADLAPQDSLLPTDLYYACLDGSWNANNDGRWGESTDGENGADVDLLAEVYVGRAPVSTPAQAETFVEKTVRYETAANPRLAEALLLATCLGDFPTGTCQGADMFRPLLPLLDRFHVSLLDDRPNKLPQWEGRDAVAALNRSPHLVLFNGHGDADILMRMHTPDLAKLTNEWPFLLCSGGCSAAEFDHGKFWPDSFGEALINGSRYGAVAAVLNARAGWFDPQYPWEYSGEFQAGLVAELLQRGHPNLGVANQNSKEELIGHVEGSEPMPYRWCYYDITLLGDPHLPFRVPVAGTATATPDGAKATADARE
jgi:hypothetical protein